jgi:hypothetical protein
MSRIAIEMLLASNVVSSGHKVQSMRFESLTDSGGVISMLRSREAHEMAGHREGVSFHPHVILSQSSNDLVGFVDRDSRDWYGSDKSGSHWMEFRFWRRFRINGVRITSQDIAFPRSFDICTGPGDNAGKWIENEDLNGSGPVLVVNFTKVMTDRLKIKQTGPNLEGSQYFNVQKIEFLSPDPEYPNGIFRTLFNQHRANIRQYIQIRARDFDSVELHNPTNVCTLDEDECWIQIELVEAKFVTSCHRFKRFTHCLRSWSLRG